MSIPLEDVQSPNVVLVGISEYNLKMVVFILCHQGLVERENTHSDVQGSGILLECTLSPSMKKPVS